MKSLQHQLERSIVICAQRATVFRFFSDSQRFGRWWGAGSAIDPRPEGNLLIVYPNGIRVSGTVLSIEQDRRISFTYGYESGQPIPIGSSIVTITLEDHPEGTLVELLHEFEELKSRDAHIPGWRYQMAVYANVVCQDQHQSLQEKVDQLFSAWSEPDKSSRDRILQEAAVDGIRFADTYGCVTGVAELSAHIAALQVHMPQTSIRRVGSLRQCQGIALADWNVTNAQGLEIAGGSNVYQLSPDGRIAVITGLWSAAE